MAEGEVRQYFVRNDKGTIWGPLTLPTIELLIDNGIMQGRLQVSEDGIRFAFPGRFPHIRDAFPREMWGDVVAPGQTVQVARAELPPEMLGQSAPGVPGASAPQVAGGAPMAGPGAMAQAAVPRAGPGAMSQAGIPRPGPGAVTQSGMPAVGPRGAAPMAGPGAVAPAAGSRPAPGAVAPAAGPGAMPGVRPAAAPPGAVPGRPSGNFRPVAPAAAPQPGPAVTPAQGHPVASPVASAAAAGAAPRAAPAPTASGSFAAVGAPPTAGAVPKAAPVMAPSGTFSAVSAPPAPPAQGSLEQLSPVALYGRIAAGSLTGLLTLTLPDRAIHLHFRKGSPEFVDSSHPEDALGTMLIQARLLSPDQFQQAVGARERFGGDLLAALFGMGLLQPATAFNHLSQRALSILLKALRAESGTFTYEPRELPAAKAMPLGNKWAVLSDQIRRIPSVDLRRRLQAVLSLPIMKSEGLVATSDLRLTPHEVRMLTFVDGVRSLAQLLADFPQDNDYLLRLAFLLKELEAVSFAAVATRAPEPKAAAPQPAPAAEAPRPAAPQPAPAAAAPRPAAPQPAPAAAAQRPTSSQPAVAPQRPTSSQPAVAPQRPTSSQPAVAAPRPVAPAASAPAPWAPAPAAPQAPAAQAPAPAAAAPPPPGSSPDDLPTLRQTAATMKGQNLFERLGVPEQTDASAVKIAYFKLAKLYHPDTLPPGAPPELEKLKAEIFGYIGDAYRTLMDDKARQDYLELIKSGDDAQEEVDVVAILQSEERFKRGIVFMKSRKYAEAVKIFDEAIQLNAEEPEFHAWRGYARFCAATDKKAAQAEAFREIQGAIKKNDRCAPAHYFLGVIAKTLGDTSGALKHFKRTVELQPDHIDALREIRMATQKK